MLYTNAHSRATTTRLKITTVGNSAGVILPKELLTRLCLEKGDELHAFETPDGLRLTIYAPELAAQMEVAESIMREDRLLAALCQGWPLPAALGVKLFSKHQ